jgi:hypothetical protein
VSLFVYYKQGYTGQKKNPSSHVDFTDRYYHLGVGPVNATKVQWVIPDVDVEQTILCGAIENRYNIKEQGVTAVY